MSKNGTSKVVRYSRDNLPPDKTNWARIDAMTDEEVVAAARSDPDAQRLCATALGLTEAGVMDKRTMKAFDEMCLTPVEELTAEQIRQTFACARRRARLCLPATSTSPPGSSASGSAARNIHAAPRSSCSHWSPRRDCRPLREHSHCRLHPIVNRRQHQIFKRKRADLCSEPRANNS